MKSRKPAVGTVFLACVSVGLLGFAAPAAAASAPTAKTASAAGTFVKAFAAVVSKSQVNVYPGDVQATSDGGSIALSETETAKGLGVDWLVKLSAAGAPQWQEEVGCASSKGAPGDYADGVSVQQTPGGGYIVGGGTIDCGFRQHVPAAQRAVVRPGREAELVGQAHLGPRVRGGSRWQCHQSDQADR